MNFREGIKFARHTRNGRAEKASQKGTEWLVERRKAHWAAEGFRFADRVLMIFIRNKGTSTPVLAPSILS